MVLSPSIINETIIILIILLRLTKTKTNKLTTRNKQLTISGEQIVWGNRSDLSGYTLEFMTSMYFSFCLFSHSLLTITVKFSR